MPARLPVDAVFLPKDLLPEHVRGRTVVVFDVLRATSSITAALAAEVAEVRIFPDPASAARAAAPHGERRILCGEVNCLPPDGFDLGNSPGAFDRTLHAGSTAFLSTTNGTKAIIAARGAQAILAGALVNATAVAHAAAKIGRAMTLLCAGTGGQPAMEDVLGAGALLEALMALGAAAPAGDEARIALRLFGGARSNLREVMSEATGGQNLLAVGLEEDIDFCARVDVIPVVGRVCDEPLRVVRQPG